MCQFICYKLFCTITEKIRTCGPSIWLLNCFIIQLIYRRLKKIYSLETVLPVKYIDFEHLDGKVTALPPIYGNIKTADLKKELYLEKNRIRYILAMFIPSKLNYK
jgi:hypothetical protein